MTATTPKQLWNTLHEAAAHEASSRNVYIKQTDESLAHIRLDVYMRMAIKGLNA